ncbi:hypothetical protein [Nostoc commune]|uniref:hypothetical protein n=1 Tax=Nostoc commune TaxID=1178 RepID=UPI0039C00051
MGISAIATSLGNEDLGEWSELGMLGVLSGLSSDFYRARLVPSLLAAPEPSPKPQPVVTLKTESPSLIARVGKLEGEKLAQVQDWCESVKHLMFPSTSGYADVRRELHLRRFVSLATAKSGKKAEVKTVDPFRYPSSGEIEELGEKLLPEFHQALVLFYPAGTQIKVHRDSLFLILRGRHKSMSWVGRGSLSPVVRILDAWSHTG